MTTPESASQSWETVENLLQSIGIKSEGLHVGKEELAKLNVSVAPEVWEEIGKTQLEAVERAEREMIRSRIKFEVRRSLVNEWLDKHTSVKKGYQRDYIQDQVAIYLRDDRLGQLSGYLADVATLGLDKANKKRSKERLGGGYFGYVVEVLLALGLLVLVVGILAAAQSKFETIVLAMLVLIYNGLEASSRTGRLLTAQTALGIDNQFRRVMRGINAIRRLEHDEFGWEQDLRIEGEQEAQKTISRATIRWYISGVAILLTTLWALFKVISVVFF